MDVSHKSPLWIILYHTSTGNCLHFHYIAKIPLSRPGAPFPWLMAEDGIRAPHIISFVVDPVKPDLHQLSRLLV